MSATAALLAPLDVDITEFRAFLSRRGCSSKVKASRIDVESPWCAAVWIGEGYRGPEKTFKTTAGLKRWAEKELR